MKVILRMEDDKKPLIREGIQYDMQKNTRQRDRPREALLPDEKDT